MKKIVAILIMLVLVATSVSAVTIKQEARKTNNSEFEEINPSDCYTYYDEAGYPVTHFPPKSDFAKSLIDETPEMGTSPDDLPSQFSWLNYNGDWTTPAKDQANCGSCWAFGALGGLEASINIKSGFHDLDIDLSEQYVLSCLPAAGSCGGGWMSEAIAYIYNENSGSTGNGINGCPIESCMPYQAVDWIPCSDKCADWDTYHDPPQENDKLWQVANYGVTTGGEDDPAYWDLMKSWCFDHGPIVVDIYTGGWSSYWSSHHDPNDVYENDDSGITNHAQLLCGWVDDPQVTNGGYWILKNSWGTSWGYNGFSNIAYGCNSVGTRDVTWVEAIQWPNQQSGPGPGSFDMHVFADYSWYPQYPHLGEEMTFTDKTDGEATQWSWDFDGDGIYEKEGRTQTHSYNQEGIYEVSLLSQTAWGTKSTRTYEVEVKEAWPPEAIIKPGEGVIADDELTYRLDGRFSYDVDTGNPVQSYFWDFDDGTTSTEPNPEHTFPQGDKIYYVELTVTDNEGASASTITEVRIDQTVPPVTEAVEAVGDDENEWYRENAKFQLKATDWTRVINTYYRLNSGSWLTYSTDDKIPIKDEGINTLEFYSTDYYGNVESVKSRQIKIDKTEPTVSASFNGPKEDEWYINEVTVTLYGEDDLSGINGYYYQYGTHSWKEYTGPFTIDDRQGEFTIYYRSQDVAGNIKDGQSVVKIQAEDGPTIPQLSGESDGTTGNQYTINVVSYDPGNQIWYYIDWDDGTTSAWDGPYESGEEKDYSHIFTQASSYNIKVKAKNQYNVESAWGSFGVSMPKTKYYNFPLIQRFFDNHPLIYQFFTRLIM